MTISKQPIVNNAISNTTDNTISIGCRFFCGQRDYGCSLKIFYNLITFYERIHHFLNIVQICICLSLYAMLWYFLCIYVQHRYKMIYYEIQNDNYNNLYILFAVYFLIQMFAIKIVLPYFFRKYMITN